MKNNKPWYKRKKVWKWIGISYLAIVLVGIVGGFLMDVTGYTDKVEVEEAQAQAKKEEDKAKASAETAKKDQERRTAEAEKTRKEVEQKKAEQERLANRTIDEKIKDAVVAVVGKDNYRNHKFEENALWIEVTAANNLTQNMVLKGTYMDALDIAKKVREESLLNGTGSFDVAYYTELTDVYGNTSDGVIVEIGMKKDTLDKIDFKNVLHSNVPKIADYYWEHPLFSKK